MRTADLPEEGSHNHSLGLGHLNYLCVSPETLILPADSLMASLILFSFWEPTFSRIQSLALSQGCTLFNTKIMNLLLLPFNYVQATG